MQERVGVTVQKIFWFVSWVLVALSTRGFALQSSQGAFSVTTGAGAASVAAVTHASKADHEDIGGKAATATSTDTMERLGASGLFDSSGESYVIVKTTSNSVQNGANLLAAYASARAHTPDGPLLNATHRAVVIVPPGNYDLGTKSIVLDTDFVDLVGLSAARDDQYIHSSDNVIVQTARNIRIENLVLHYTGSDDFTYAYKPSATWNDGVSHTGSPPQTRIHNCEFRASDFGMRYGTEYAGRYDECTCESVYAFGGSGGIASGTFVNCTGGNESFGGSGGVASGTFINCTGGYYAFAGVLGRATGVFTSCTGGDYAFGSSGVASGTFTNCTGGRSAFGGEGGSADGGKFYYCVGGVGAFTESGSPAPIHLFCIQNGAPYSGNN